MLKFGMNLAVDASKEAFIASCATFVLTTMFFMMSLMLMQKVQFA